MIKKIIYNFLLFNCFLVINGSYNEDYYITDKSELSLLEGGKEFALGEKKFVVANHVVITSGIFPFDDVNNEPEPIVVNFFLREAKVEQKFEYNVFSEIDEIVSEKTIIIDTFLKEVTCLPAPKKTPSADNSQNQSKTDSSPNENSTANPTSQNNSCPIHTQGNSPLILRRLSGSFPYNQRSNNNSFDLRPNDEESAEKSPSHITATQRLFNRYKGITEDLFGSSQK